MNDVLMETSINRIKEGEKLALALNPQGGYFVSFSGGKDSQVVLELCRLAGVRYRAFYIVTGNDAPANIYFIREYYPEVEFLHPKKNFFRLVEDKGLPTVMRRYCCERLKEHHGAGNVVLTGVRWEESRKRAQYSPLMVRSRRKEWEGRDKSIAITDIEPTEHRCIKGQDKIMFYPIIDWLEADVWHFLKSGNYPINPLYDKVGRVGCMFCPFSNAKQMEWYASVYPGFERLLVRSLGRFWEKSERHAVETPEEYYCLWRQKKKVTVKPMP